MSQSHLPLVIDLFASVSDFLCEHLVSLCFFNDHCSWFHANHAKDKYLVNYQYLIAFLHWLLVQPDAIKFQPTDTQL